MIDFHASCRTSEATLLSRLFLSSETIINVLVPPSLVPLRVFEEAQSLAPSQPCIYSIAPSQEPSPVLRFQESQQGCSRYHL